MQRDRSIDLMKSILVVGMITAHVIQLFCTGSFISDLFSTYINMITFSGFVFCFGYACNIAYLRKNKDQVGYKILRNAVKTLVAFYISGIFFRIFVSGFDFKIISFAKIILLWDIPGYSEFLISFSILSVLTYIFFEQIKLIIKSKYFIFILIATLLSTFIPYNMIKINQLGLIIGTEKFLCFPVLQYLSFYLLGMYFQENKINFRISYLVLAIGASMLTIINYVIFKEVPKRFPPSIMWILSPGLYLYIYYLVSKRITQKYNIYRWIFVIGENTLDFLLFSNIIMFVGYYIVRGNKFSAAACIIGAMAIITFIYIMLKLLRINKNKHAINDKVIKI